jgi:DNA-binding GntR family transcriptional regulator
MPQRPVAVNGPALIREEPRHPYQVVAAAVASHIDAGTLPSGSSAPAAADLAKEHDVSLATAKRSLRLLTEWGLLTRRDRNTLLVAAATLGPSVPKEIAKPVATSAPDYVDSLLAFTLRRGGSTIARFSSVADPSSAIDLRQVLVGAVERAGGGNLVEFELDVSHPGARQPILTFAVSA